MSIKLDLENGEKIEIDYKELITRPIERPITLEEDKEFWLRKLNDFAVRELSTENTQFLKGAFNLAVSLRDPTEPGQIEARLAILRDRYLDANGDLSINVAGADREASINAINTYLLTPSPANRDAMMNSLGQSVGEIEAVIWTNSTRYKATAEFQADYAEYLKFRAPSASPAPTTRPRAAGSPDFGRPRSDGFSGGIRADFNPFISGDGELVESIAEKIGAEGWKTVQREVEKKISRQVAFAVRYQSPDRDPLSFQSSTVGELTKELSKLKGDLQKGVRQTMLDTIRALAAAVPENSAGFDYLSKKYLPEEINRFFDIYFVNERYERLIQKPLDSESYVDLVLKKTLLESKQQWLTERVADPDFIGNAIDNVDYWSGETSQEINSRVVELQRIQSQLASISESASEHPGLKSQEQTLLKEIDELRQQQDKFDQQKEELDLDKYEDHKEKVERELTERRPKAFRAEK